MPMPVIVIPAEIRRRGPRRLIITPEIGDITIIVITIGSNATPVFIGEKPWMFC